MPATPNVVPREPAVRLEFLRNAVREPMRTCRVCAARSTAITVLAMSRPSTLSGLADLVVPLAYAIDGTESAVVVRNYKNHPMRLERERCCSVIREVLRLGMSLHERCIGAVVGQPVSTRVVIPSLTSRLGTHPMMSIAESLGLVGDVVLKPAFDVRCDRVVDAEKFVVEGAVTGRHVVVLDDVWTTGSNAQSAALTLRRAGAAGVSVMVIARWLTRRHPLSAKFIREQPPHDYNPQVCPVTGHRCP